MGKGISHGVCSLILVNFLTNVLVLEDVCVVTN